MIAIFAAWTAEAAPVAGQGSLGVVGYGGGSYASSWEGVDYTESVVARRLPNLELGGGVRIAATPAVHVGGDLVLHSHLENLYSGRQPAASLQAAGELGQRFRAGLSAGYAVHFGTGAFHGPIGGLTLSAGLGPLVRLGAGTELYHLAWRDESTTGWRLLARLVVTP